MAVLVKLLFEFLDPVLQKLYFGCEAGYYLTLLSNYSEQFFVGRYMLIIHFASPPCFFFIVADVGAVVYWHLDELFFDVLSFPQRFIIGLLDGLNSYHSRL